MPFLSSVGVPVIGETFLLQLHGARAAAPAALWLGFSDMLWLGVPLPLDLHAFGAPGCPVLISWDSPRSMTTSASGTAQVSLSIPADHGLLGVRVMTQALVVDPPANALGVTVSNAGRIVIGG
jgi:hypothetical protein